MFGFLRSLVVSTSKKERAEAPVFFTNTLSKKKELFAPLKAGVASFYSCGPTVYDRAHIGNLRAYVVSDLAARTLLSAGYHVRRVINITDVGHLVGDAEEGEDKMSVAAKKSRTRPEEIAERYTQLFVADIAALNIDTTSILFPKATQYLKEQIAMIKVLEAKGVTYKISDGLYFDTSLFPDYGKLGGISDEALKQGTKADLTDRIQTAVQSRIGENREKRNPADFALWRKAKPGDLQQWPSPWGYGNPGWHIECSAMIKSILGETIDLHSGGIDHIPVHHNNEIAQSEVANTRPLARYWLHLAHLSVNDEKISKSLKNDIYLSEITERGFSPLSLRYFFLQAHYRTTLSFTWESLKASNEALMRLWRICAQLKEAAKGEGAPCDESRTLTTLLRDDLSTPQALALLWESLKNDELSPKQQLAVVLAAEPVLGLMLTNPPIEDRSIPYASLPDDIKDLLQEREDARGERNYEKADRIRDELARRGYRVEDGASGALVTRESR